MAERRRCAWPRSRSVASATPKAAAPSRPARTRGCCSASKPAFDGAVASGNGIAALNAVELARLTGDPAWADRAEGALRAFAEGMSQAPLAHVTLARALERLLAAPRATIAPPRRGTRRPRRAARQATAPAPATGTLEDEAYDAVEIEARLGTSEDEDWKPFRVEMTVRKGWHVNANPAGPGLVADRGGGRRGTPAQRPVPRRGEPGTAAADRCRSTRDGSRSRARSSARAAAPAASRSATRPATTPVAFRPSRGSCACADAP